MFRSELAEKYRVETRTIYSWLVRYGLYTDEVKNQKIIPARVVAKFIEKHGHWEYPIDES